MNNEIIPIYEPPLPQEIKVEAAQSCVTINMDEIPKNSVLIIKLNVNNPEEKMAVLPTIAKLFVPYKDILREKSVTVMMIGAAESIDIIPEAEMNKAGWHKKEQSLIINPFTQ